MNLIAIIFWSLVIFNVTVVPIMFILMLMSWAVAKPYLAAKFRKAPLIEVERSDGRTVLVTGKYGSNMLDTGEKYGSFIVTPEGTKPFYGVMLGRACERIGVIVDDKFRKASETLSKAGLPSYHAATSKLPDFIKKRKEEKYDKRTKEGSKKAARLEQIIESISVIQNYFKYKLHPAQINEKISNAIRRHETDNKRNFVMTIGVIGAVIAVVFIGGAVFITQSKCVDCGKLYDAGLKAGKAFCAKVAASSVD